MADKIDSKNVQYMLPLNNMQQSLLFSSAHDQGNDKYRVNCQFSVVGHLDLNRLEAAYQKVVSNNDSLRQRFRWEGLKKPVAVILEKVESHIQLIDLSWKRPDAKDVALAMRTFTHREGDLDSFFGLSLDCVKECDDKWHLVLCYHHILMDGWSLNLFLEELFTHYYGEAVPSKKGRHRSIFRDLTTKSNLKEARVFWKDYLSDCKPSIGLYRPTNTQRLSNVSHADTRRIRKRIDAGVYSGIATRAKRLNVTVSDILLTAVGLVFRSLYNESDFLIGITTSGRSADVECLDSEIGLFTNTVPFRYRIKNDQTVEAFIHDNHRNIIEINNYDTATITDIKSWCSLTGSGRLFDALLVVENYPINDSFFRGDEAHFSDINVKEDSEFPITVAFLCHDELTIEIDYRSECYSEQSMSRLSEKLLTAFSMIVEGGNPRIKELDFLVSDEKQSLLKTFNPEKVTTRFEEKVIAQIYRVSDPSLEAIVFRHESLSYQDLCKKADTVAQNLIESHVVPGQIVVLVFDLGIDVIASMLGVLRAGAGFLPLDSYYPDARKRLVIESVRPAVILCDQENALFVREFSDVPTLVFGDLKSIDNELPDVNTLRWDFPAYIISSSGSTGAPKNVLINQKAFKNFNDWASVEYEHKKGYRTLLSNSFAFDSAIQMIFPALSTGGTLHLLDSRVRLDASAYFRYLSENRINNIDELPSVMSILFSFVEERQLFDGAELLPELTMISLGSEYVPIEVPRLSKKYFNRNGKVINGYGPAEASVETCTYVFDGVDEKESSLIGKPREGTNVYILDSDLNLCSIGASGELCISGVALADGYYDNEAYTKLAFVENPFYELDGFSILYRTGDLARWLEDGNIEFLGRNDQQVKVRGHRVEIPEVEGKLYGMKGIKNAAVVSVLDEGETSLIAFIELEGQIDKSGIDDELRRLLPQYMIPREVIYLQEIPKNPNGKFDRRKLLDYSKNNRPEALVGETERVPEVGLAVNFSRSDSFQKVLGVWKGLLNVSAIDPSKSFFEVGGDSLKLMRMQLMLQKEFPEKHINIDDLFTYTSINEQTKYLDPASVRSSEYKTTLYKTQENPGKSNSGASIIGIGLNLPEAETVEEFWANIATGKELITPISEDRIRLDLEKFPAKEYLKWGYLKSVGSFYPEYFNISPRLAKLMDPHQRLILETVDRAIIDAGYTKESIANRSVGVFVGATLPNYYRHLDAPIDEVLSSNLPANLAGRIAYHFSLNGPAMVLDTACSSTLTAVHVAFQSLMRGECDMAIVGGVHLELELLNRNSAFASGVVSKSQQCRSFSADSDGTIGGEGCVVILISKDEDSGAYASIKGSGLSQNGSRSNGIMAPNSDAQAESIQTAWMTSGIDPKTVGYIETHGTGTKLGDPIEIMGLSKFFGEAVAEKQSIPIGSVKPNYGHLDNAAGLLGLVKAALSLQMQEIPPLANFSKANENIDFANSPFYVCQESEEWKRSTQKCRSAGVSSFGLSGTNCHVVLQEAESQIASDDIGIRSERLKDHISQYSENCEEYWIGTDVHYLPKKNKLLAEVGETLIEEKILHQVEWTTTELINNRETKKDSGALILSFGVENKHFSTHLMQNYFRVHKVEEADCFKRLSQNETAMNYLDSGCLLEFLEDYCRDIGDKNLDIFLVISIDGQKVGNEDVIRRIQCLQSVMKQVLCGVKAKSQYSKNIKIYTLTESSYQVLESDVVKNPWNAMLHSMFRSISRDHADADIVQFDFEDLSGVRADYFSGDYPTQLVAVRKGQVYTQSLNTKSVRHPDDGSLAKGELIRSGGNYLISGGLSGVGLAIAESIAKFANVRFVLFVRHLGEKKLAKKFEVAKAILDRIERLGSRVDIVEVDITDREQLKIEVDRIKNSYGAIHGVFHTAGQKPNHADIFEVDKAFWGDLYRGKVQGMINLSDVFSNDNLDFFLSFSSVDAVLNPKHSFIYSMENAFLGSYSAFLRNEQKNYINIFWGGWIGLGMGREEGNALRENGQLLPEGFSVTPLNIGFEPKIGIQCFWHVLENRIPEILVSYIGSADLKTIASEKFLRVELAEENTVAENAVFASLEEVEDIIDEIWKDNLDYSSSLDRNADIYEVGGDSIVFAKIFSDISKQFNIELAIDADALSMGIESIARLVHQKLGGKSNTPKRAKIGKAKSIL